MPNHRYRLRDTTVTAVRWHGNHAKRDSIDEIQEALKPKEPIHRLLNGLISVADDTSPDGHTHSVLVMPGEWIVRGLKDEMITMTDDLFRVFFKEVE
jgi:hypothetical protein